MALSFGGNIFKREMEFEDSGAAKVKDWVNGHLFGKKTISGTITSGAVTDIHDFSNTTYMYLTEAGGSPDIKPNIVYDLHKKMTVKSIEVDTACWEEGGASNGKLQVAYSDDNVNWTQEYLSAGANTEVKRAWSGGGFKARYVRIGNKMDGGTVNGYLKLFEIRIIT